MSLIKCSECGKEISDKAPVCIHCGCPLEKDKELHTTKKFVYMCMSTSCLSNPFKEFDEYKEGKQICPDCGKQLEYYETEIIENNSDLVVKRFKESEENMHNSQFSNMPKCPTCSSTNVKRVSGTSKAISVVMFGLFSQKAKKQFHCNNCGYKW